MSEQIVPNYPAGSVAVVTNESRAQHCNNHSHFANMIQSINKASLFARTGKQAGVTFTSSIERMPEATRCQQTGPVEWLCPRQKADFNRFLAAQQFNALKIPAHGQLMGNQRLQPQLSIHHQLQGALGSLPAVTGVTEQRHP